MILVGSQQARFLVPFPGEGEKRGAPPLTHTTCCTAHACARRCARCAPTQNTCADAVVQYSRALALEPRHFKALFNRAFSHDKLGNYAAAIEDYSAAIAVDSSNSYACVASCTGGGRGCTSHTTNPLTSGATGAGNAS